MAKQDIIKVFERRIAPRKIPGASLVVVGEKEDFIHNYGVSRMGGHDYVTDNTAYAVGSLTKIFTGLITAKMIGEGKLKLTHTIGELLPNRPIAEGYKKISIRELVTHTSGLPRLPANLDDSITDSENPYKNYGEENLLEFLAYGELEEKGKMVYSNVGYGILGYLLEQVTGAGYNELLWQQVGQPLGMRHTFAYDGVHLPPNTATGYNLGNKEADMWYLNALQGAGGIITTPADMRKFLSAMVGLTPNPLESAIAQSRKLLNGKMAYAWMRHNLAMRLSGAQKCLWHNGMTFGFGAYTDINPKRKKAFVIMYNKSVDPLFVSLHLIARITLNKFFFI